MGVCEYRKNIDAFFSVWTVPRRPEDLASDRVTVR